VVIELDLAAADTADDLAAWIWFNRGEQCWLDDVNWPLNDEVESSSTSFSPELQKEELRAVNISDS
jgi:hypothetical protein